jgi:predicted Zn-dependent protease
LCQRNWHVVDSYQFDWSIFLKADKAVKSSFAGENWDAGELGRRIARRPFRLATIRKTQRSIQQGQYRAFLTPAAMDEILGMLNWDGVSGRSQATRQSALQRLVDGQTTLASQISLQENTAEGMSPCFDDAGFAKPARVPLIQAGAHAGALVSARTAKEYDLQSNGANEEESMQSSDLAGGTLPLSDSLAALDRGILVATCGI